MLPQDQRPADHSPQYIDLKKNCKKYGKAKAHFNKAKQAWVRIIFKCVRMIKLSDWEFKTSTNKLSVVAASFKAST